MGRSSWRSAMAIGLSMAGHLALIVWVREQRLDEPLPPPPRAAPLTWIDVLPPPPPAPAPPPTSQRSTVRSTSPRVDQQPVVVEAVATPPADATASAPSRVRLTPSDDVLGTVPGGSESTGRTLHPGDEPSEDELLAEETERVHDRVDGWVRSSLRRQRVTNGIVDAEYSDLQKQLAAATDTVPDLIGLDDPKAVVNAVKDAWQTGAERYGKTGAPYDTPEGWNPAIEQPESLMRLAKAGSPEMQNFVQFLSAGARLQEFADGRAGKELIAHVALTQAADGSVLELRLAQPSGLKPFDTWVMETARTTLAGVHLDAGTRERGFFSVWQFAGRISFVKKATAPTVRDLAGTLPLVVLSALTGGRVPIALGRFDETTGEVEVVDLSSPHYECRVTLLEAE
ncbi:MAG: hypothetical protein Q8L14_11235 [Myxococcales bacterium]|nr:hypothetical protein [Myxococcales bacterium]